MPILKNVLGLDLGSYALKAVEVRQTLRGFEAVQLRSLPRPVEDVALPELIQHFVRMHRLPTEHVVVALAADRVSSRRLAFPFHDKKKLSAAVPFEVEGDLLFDIEDVLIDWEVVGGDRTRSQVVATVAPRKEVSELLEALREAGCDPRTVDAEGLVLGNLPAVFHLPGNRLVLDLGHRKTTCCLLVEGRAVAARSLAVGGLALTRALAADRGLSLEDAERAKCEEGLLRPGLAVASPQAGAILDRLAREIARTLGAFEPALAGFSPVSELTLIGGTAQLDRLDEYLTERTGIPAARIGLPVEGQGEALAAGGPPTVFAPAIAVALRGTTQARTRTDFRQDEFAVRVDLSRYGRHFRSTAVLAVLALLLAITSFATATWVESRRAAALEAQVAALYHDAFPKQPVPANPVAAIREEVRAAHERAEFLGVYRGNLSALDLLTELSRYIPADLEVSFEELTIDRQNIRMRVYAESFESTDRIRSELAKFPAFRDARIGTAETDPKTGKKRFSVTISLASDPEDAS